MLSDLYVNLLENNFALSEKYVVNFDGHIHLTSGMREREREEELEYLPSVHFRSFKFNGLSSFRSNKGSVEGIHLSREDKRFVYNQTRNPSRFIKGRQTYYF